MTFEDYTQDRKYLRNVSPKTLAWYKDIQRAFGSYLVITSAAEFRQSAMKAVTTLLARGVKPVSVNSWLTGIRAYGIWLWKEGHLKEKPRIELLKCEQKILSTFSHEQVARLVHWKPSGRNQSRAHVIALAALDTGMRISELLSLTREDVDFDNLVLRVHGKGNKQRLVPMSGELRKALFRYMTKNNTARVFCTSVGTRVSVRNSARDFSELCGKAGITGVRTSWHTLRHTFAVNYLRRGGNLYYLQRILGHSSITTTERYLRSLGIEDLRKVHDGLSLISG